jgi:hypothetical protein
MAIFNTQLKTALNSNILQPLANALELENKKSHVTAKKSRQHQHSG